MKKRIVALFLTLVSLLTVFAFAGCKPNPKDENNENEQEQNKNSDPGIITHAVCDEETMLKYRAIYEETGCNPVIDASDYIEETVEINGKTVKRKLYTNVTVNAAYAVGFGTYKIVTSEEFEAIQQYQNETGKQVIYPTVNVYCRDDSNLNDNTIAKKDVNDANIYYLTEISGNKTKVVFSSDEKFIPNYWKLEEGQKSALAATYNSLRIEGENGFVEDGKQYFYVYGRKVAGGNIEVRVFRHEYELFLQKTTTVLSAQGE